MKFILSATMTVFIAASTIAQADNSSASGVVADSLGLPSSASVLTEKESGDTRGMSWHNYIDTKAEYRAAGCNTKALRDTHECKVLYYTKEEHYYNWQYWKAIDITDQGWMATARARSNSY